MSNVPEGATLSEDGYYWWDGTDWQEVVEDAPSPSGEAAGSGESSGEITYEELAAITSEDQLEEKYQSHFQPDYEKLADDDSLAEASADL